MLIKSKFRLALIFALLFTQSFSVSDISAQEEAFRSGPILKTVKIGPHPVYTRILIDLTEPVLYKVDANFSEKRIVLTLPETQSGPRVRGKAFNDKNLEQFTVSSRAGKIKVSFILKQLTLLLSLLLKRNFSCSIPILKSFISLIPDLKCLIICSLVLIISY